MQEQLQVNFVQQTHILQNNLTKNSPQFQHLQVKQVGIILYIFFSSVTTTAADQPASASPTTAYFGRHSTIFSVVFVNFNLVIMFRAVPGA